MSAASLTITSVRFPMKIRQISVGAFRDTFPPANIFNINAIFCLESASSTANGKGMLQSIQGNDMFSGQCRPWRRKAGTFSEYRKEISDETVPVSAILA